MKEEYSFTLTLPLEECELAETLLQETRQRFPSVRITRKTDRKGCARFYLSFPLTQARQDLKFASWFSHTDNTDWELFGPTYGRWGFS